MENRRGLSALRWVGGLLLAAIGLGGAVLAGPHAPRGLQLEVRRPGIPSGMSGSCTAGPVLDRATREKISAALWRLPLAFETNRGQAGAGADFVARGPGYNLFLSATRTVLAALAPPDASGKARATVVRMQLRGADRRAQSQGLHPLPAKSHYLIGNDARRWHTDISSFGKVRYRSVYPGIDLVYYGRQNELEYDFVVAPRADPNRIRLAFGGVRELGIAANGDLVLSTAAGELRQRRPAVYQDLNGRRRTVPAKFVRTARREVGFRLGRYDRDRPLIIDPVLAYSTLVGGTNDDYGMGIAVDADNNAYVTGYTGSFTRLEDTGPNAIENAVPRYPVVPGLLPFPTVNPLLGDPDGVGVATLDLDLDGAAETTFVMSHYDAFVFKMNATGSGLIFSTYLGGVFGDDYGTGIAVDPSGSTYVTGMTRTRSFPTERPIQATNFGGTDAFIAKLTASGNRLVYSTYYGGSGDDIGRGIAVDANGNCIVTGLTTSADLTTFRAFDDTYGGGGDQFVVNINALGSAFNYATYLGGSATEGGFGPDEGAVPYVTHVPMATIVGVGVFPGARLDNGAQKLGPDFGAAVAVDSLGNAYVTGTTVSPDFPVTAGAVQTAPGGGTDAFVTKFDPFGRVLPATGGFSTFLGGSGDDGGRGIAVDRSGNPHVVGYTSSANFPTMSPFQGAYNGGARDAFLTRLVPAGTAMTYSTFLGGSGDDVANGVAVDLFGNAFVTGYTQSVNFPTLTPLQGVLRVPVIGTAQDAFVTKFLPSGSEIEYSTFLGAAQQDFGMGVALNSVGTAFVTGITFNLLDAAFSNPSSFPTTIGSFQRFGAVPLVGGFITTAYGQDPAAGFASTYPVVDSFVARVANPPAPPSDLTITGVAQRGIDIAWGDNSNNETFFEIERKRASGEFALVAAVAANKVTYSDTGLDPATTYVYRVRAGNLEGTSAYTNQATSTTLPDPPAAPSNLVVTSVDRARLRLDWRDNSNNETAFRIERKSAGLQFREIAVVAADTTAFTDSGLDPGTKYTYRLLATNLGGSSAFSNEAEGTTLPDPPANAPTNLTAVTASSRKIDLTWDDDNPNETGFKIERKVDTGVFDVVRILTGGEIIFRDGHIVFSDDGLVQQTTYVYRVRAFNITGDGPASNNATATTQAAPPVPPTKLNAVSASASQVNLTWQDNSADEDGFRIERSTDGSTFAEIASVGANVVAYSDVGVANVTLYYRVRAAKAGVFSDYSNVAARDGRPSPPSELAAAASSFSEIVLTWRDNSSNENLFKIERGTDGSTFTEIATVGEDISTYTDRDLNANTTFFYRVRSSTPDGDSPFSNIASATTKPAPPRAPSNLRGRFTGTQIDLEWIDNSSDEDSFEVERSIDGATFVRIAEGLPADTEAYSDAGRDANTTYFYRVRAKNVGGFSDYSNVAKITVPPSAPTTLTAETASSSQVRLRWKDNSTNESGFEIERRTGEGDFAKIASVAPNTTTYLDRDLSGGTSYTYRIRAFNDGGFSAYSNEATAGTEALLVSLTISPATVRGGRPATGTVRIGTPAPAGGVAISLASFNTRLATVPDSVTIPAGGRSASFNVATVRRTAGRVEISAAFGGVTRLATLRVRK